MRDLHVLSLGAGVQSTAVYILMAEKLLEVPEDTAAIFADTQEEPDRVYQHLDWLKQAYEWPRILTTSIGKLGEHLVNGVNSSGQRCAAIPAFTTDGGDIGQTRRQCSREYKTRPIQRAIREQVLGLRYRQKFPADVHVIQYFGISRDEARRSVNIKERVREWNGAEARFPLLELGWTRADCLRFLDGRVPHQVPKSSCVFCPYHSDRQWLDLKQNDPKGWARAVVIDTALRTSGAIANRDMRQTMYVHRSCRPLEQVELNESQLEFPGFVKECEGVCGV